MIIRRKIFTEQQSQFGNDITSKDLQIEHARLQRELIRTQRMRQKLQAEERESMLNRSVRLQNMKQREDMEDTKAKINIKRLEGNNSFSPSMYKSKPHPVPPVPMK